MCAYEISKQSNCPTLIFDKHGECINECPEDIDDRNDWAGKQCIPKMKTCPSGTMMIDGTCRDKNKNSLCPVGQDLVKTASDFDCIYHQPNHLGHGTKLASCNTGQILSQAMRMFYCETNIVPSSEVMECHFDEIFVKIGGGYACITEQEASLQCTGK